MAQVTLENQPTVDVSITVKEFPIDQVLNLDTHTHIKKKHTVI